MTGVSKSSGKRAVCEKGQAQGQSLSVEDTLMPPWASGAAGPGRQELKEHRGGQAPPYPGVQTRPKSPGEAQRERLAKSRTMRDHHGSRKTYSLANVILICELLIVEAKLVNKIGRHLLHLIIRKGLATPGPVTVT